MISSSDGWMDDSFSKGVGKPVGLCRLAFASVVVVVVVSSVVVVVVVVLLVDVVVVVVVGRRSLKRR